MTTNRTSATNTDTLVELVFFAEAAKSKIGRARADALDAAGRGSQVPNWRPDHRAFLLGLMSTVGAGALSLAEVSHAWAQATTPAPTPPPASTQTPAPAQTQAPAPAKSKDAAGSEIVVTGRIARTDTVTNIPVPLIETTQAVTVLTQEDLQIGGVTNFNEIGRVESGSYEPGSRGGFTRSYFRGFEDNSYTDNAIKIDGYRIMAEIVPELFLYESIQQIKGSAATNFGQSSVGGTQVAITKQPKDYFGGTASTEIGSYDHYGVNFDVYGPITPDAKLTGRFVGVAYTELSPFDYLGEQRYTVGPSLKYKFTPYDDLVFVGSYSRSAAGSSLGFPLALNSAGPGGATNQANYSIPAVKFSQLGDSAPWARIDKNYANAELTYTHVFKGGFWDGWRLKVGVEHNEVNTPDSKWAWVGDFNVIPTDKTKGTALYLYWGVNKTHQWAGQVNLLGEVQALGHTQSFSIGGDYTQNTIGYHPYESKLIPASPTGFNIYQNNWSVLPGGYSSTQQFFNEYGTPTFAYSYDYEVIDYGEEAQFLLHPIDHLTINLGGRFSFSALNQRDVYNYPADISSNFPPYTEERPDQHKFTYQTGATYALPVPKFLGNINAYISYGTTFDGGSAFAYNPAAPESVGKFLGPILGRTYEAGLKGDSASAGASYNWSLDYFDTANTNAFQTDPLHPKFSEALGEQEATGWEFEFHGKPKPGWNLFVSASSTWNIYTAGALKGVNSPFAPLFGLSSWSTYEFQSGPLAHFGYGIGWVHKTRPPYFVYGSQYGGDLILRNAFRTHVDEYDARLFYHPKPWQIDLSVENFTDERYASAEDANFIGDYIFMNNPMMAMLKVTRSF